MSQPVRLVDATLRDGSYCVDFQFTLGDTAVVVGMLDAAGVEYIELGHGSGTFHHKAPANIRSKIRQQAKDEEYLAVARKCAPRAKLGVITGSFGTEDLQALVEHRLDFVRLACMADRALEPANMKMAERAKALGLICSVNLMQTVAISPTRLAEITVEYSKLGADWMYIVDSSGGLLPKSVTEYVTHARDASDMIIGFHAHHNSGFAIANSFAAIEAGALLVDGTLQGLGRDVGNAPTEQLLFMLQRMGHERSIDAEQLCHLGDLVRGLLLEKGQDPTYFAAGASEVHSSNVEALVQFAKERGLGPRSLLAAIGHGEVKLIGAGMTTFPDAILLPAIARSITVSDSPPRAEVIGVLAEDITRASSTSLPILADVLFARAAKWHKRSVLHLVPQDELPFHGPLPWDFDRLCGITIGVNRNDLGSLELGDRQPDVLVIDPSLNGGPLPLAKSSCVDAFLPVLVDSALTLATLSAHAGANVWLVCSDAGTAAQLAARADQSNAIGDVRTRVLGPADGGDLGAVTKGDTVIVVGYRNLPARVATLASRGVRLLRPGLATGIATRISNVLDVSARLAGNVEGSPLVDPIFIPSQGQVVVDDPICPSTVVSGTSRDRSDARTAAAIRARTLARGLGRL